MKRAADMESVVHIVPRLLDRRRMSETLSISEDTLDLMRKMGCPSIRVPGTTKLLFDPDDVVRWLKDCAAEPLSASEADASERLHLALHGSR